MLCFTLEQRKGHWLNHAYYIILSFGFCNLFRSSSLRLFKFKPLHEQQKFLPFSFLSIQLYQIDHIAYWPQMRLVFINGLNTTKEESQNLHCFRCFNGFQCDVKINWIDLTHTTCFYVCECVCVRWKSHCYSIMYEKMKSEIHYITRMECFVRLHSSILRSHSLVLETRKKRKIKGILIN